MLQELLLKRPPNYTRERDSVQTKPAKKNSPTKLSKREYEILQHMADGLSTKNIAAFLYISFDTVESHRKSIYKKLKINSAPEAIAYGFRNKLIK